jgi:ADP-heptose:LPS heptosyltransferase
VVALCNGAFALPYWLRKRWPHFAALSRVLRLHAGASVVGVGNAGELEGVEMARDYTGNLSILETARVLQQADLVVTTDTGCMHLADVLRRPIVALFGATLASKNRPRNPAAHTLCAGSDCAPCLDTPRFSRCSTLPSPCMASISVGDAMAAAKKVLHG